MGLGGSGHELTSEFIYVVGRIPFRGGLKPHFLALGQRRSQLLGLPHSVALSFHPPPPKPATVLRIFDLFLPHFSDWNFCLPLLLLRVHVITLGPPG